MKLASKILVELGQVLPEALIEEQDARPFLRPDFSQVVTIPGVITPINNVPSNVQQRSFLFGASVQRVNQGTTSVTLAVLAPGYWRIQYNIVFTVINFVTNLVDAFSLTLGGTRHRFVSVIRGSLSGAVNSVSFSNHLDILLRDETNLDQTISTTAAGETVYHNYAFNCQKLL